MSEQSDYAYTPQRGNRYGLRHDPNRFLEKFRVSPKARQYDKPYCWSCGSTDLDEAWMNVDGDDVRFSAGWSSLTDPVGRNESRSVTVCNACGQEQP